MRVLLLCHSFNSLSQRLHVALRAAGHEVAVELDIADAVTEEAVAMYRPQVVVASFLKRMIPATVWQQVPCLVVHPGPPGDQGPSALDRAVLEALPQWGVTVLQADGEFDAGPVWAHAGYPMRAATKSSLYRRETAEGAVSCVLSALSRMAEGQAPPPRPAVLSPRGWRPPMRQDERRIDWPHDTTERVLAKLRCSDGQPGVADEIEGMACHLHDPHSASPDECASAAGHATGALVAQRDGAFLRRTADGAVWIGQARNPAVCGDGPAFKLPCAQAFEAQAARLPVWPAALERPDDVWAELRYRELGPAGARVGVLSFDFCNGAMSTAQCERLLAALREVKRRPTRVLLFTGGAEFFSNGIHLNCIEAAAHRADDSAADESWRNISAMDDVALELITTTDRLVVSVLRGNAGAGGAFLALAADEVWAHAGVVLNPHYKNMGNLYGSEYWTYLCPRRLGEAGTAGLMAQRLPVGAAQAQAMGLIDRCVEMPPGPFEHEVTTHALAMAASHNVGDRIAAKQRQRAADEAARPLAAYREAELARMHRNFYGFDPSYHVARYHFVHKLAHAWTPRHLAWHRENP